MPLSFNNSERIFSIKNDHEFNEVALELFHFQYLQNPVYSSFVNFLGIDISLVTHYQDIPCLPIEFFKNNRVITGNRHIIMEFQSSGTTGLQTSVHHVVDIELYKQSFIRGFNLFYGNPEEYIILGLLPSYLERQDSSLVFMVEELIRLSHHQDSGFYLDDYKRLNKTLKAGSGTGRKTLLLGVSFALLDFCEQFPQSLPDLMVMETGGMKGRRSELIREELHHKLRRGFGVDSIHSEYGMTELFSQAYSKGEGLFSTPPWMKVLIREGEDPLRLVKDAGSGGINIIDLANMNSCAFIATQDLGKQNSDGRFEILGRFDSSDIRGCNLMML